MKLYKLEVHQRNARAKRDGLSVRRRRITVRRLRIHAACAAGSENRGLCVDQLEFTVAHVVRNDAGSHAAFNAKRGAEVFFVNFDVEPFELLPQRMQNHKARNVRGVTRARSARAAEWPLRYSSVR